MLVMDKACMVLVAVKTWPHSLAGNLCVVSLGDESTRRTHVGWGNP